MKSEELASLLIELQRTRDPAVLGRIFDATVADVFAFAMTLVRDRSSAEDLTQAVFEIFRRRYSTIQNALDLRSWLLGVARKEARQHRPKRKEELFGPAELELLFIAEESEESPLKILLNKDAARVLQKALVTLNPTYRRCLELLYFQGCTAREAAQEMNVKVETIHRYHCKALERLGNSKELEDLL